MKKNLFTLFIAVLVAVIAIQSYLLYKKESITIETIPDEPKVTVNIQKNKPTNAQPADNTTQPQHLNTEKLEHDIKKIFQDILGSKEVQDGLTTMQEQLKTGMQKAEKEMNSFLKEFDTMVKNDTFFKDIFKNFDISNYKQFEDKGDHYLLKLPNAKDSKVNINTKGNLLSIMMEQKSLHDINKTQILIIIPSDAFVDKLQTIYKDKILEIIVPKITKTDI